jgi:hypothetical protein
LRRRPGQEFRSPSKSDSVGLKYNRLGIPWELDGVNLVTKDTIERLTKVTRDEGLGFVQWSGMTRMHKELS